MFWKVDQVCRSILTFTRVRLRKKNKLSPLPKAMGSFVEYLSSIDPSLSLSPTNGGKYRQRKETFQVENHTRKEWHNRRRKALELVSFRAQGCVRKKSER